MRFFFLTLHHVVGDTSTHTVRQRASDAPLRRQHNTRKKKKKKRQVEEDDDVFSGPSTHTACFQKGRQTGRTASSVSQISWLYRATTLPSNVLAQARLVTTPVPFRRTWQCRASTIWWCGHFRKLSTPLLFFFLFFFPQISSGGGLFSGFLVVVGRKNLLTRSEARVSNRWISSKAREKSSETKVDTVIALDETGRAWSDR